MQVFRFLTWTVQACSKLEIPSTVGMCGKSFSLLWFSSTLPAKAPPADIGTEEQEWRSTVEKSNEFRNNLPHDWLFNKPFRISFSPMRPRVCVCVCGLVECDPSSQDWAIRGPKKKKRAFLMRCDRRTARRVMREIERVWWVFRTFSLPRSWLAWENWAGKKSQRKQL